jgi:hypothetical protein
MERNKILDARNVSTKPSSIADSWNPKFVPATATNRAGSTNVSQTEITEQMY